MKKMKRFFALFLAMAMVLGMSMTVFASQTTTKKSSATIKVTNVQDIIVDTDEGEKTYKADLKYLQVIEADPSTSTGWAFVGGDEGEIAKAYINAFTAEGESAPSAQAVLKQLTEVSTKQQSADKKESNANVAVSHTSQISKALKTIAKLKDQFKPMNSNPMEVNKAGVYAIIIEQETLVYNPMAAYVGFGVVKNEDGEVINGYPSLLDTILAAKKTDISVNKTVEEDDSVVEIGDVVKYTITATVPYIDPTDTNKAFKIKDTITGATYYLETIGDVEAVANVKMDGGNVEVNDQSGKALFDVDGSSFTIDLESLINDENSNAGKTITVEYTAKVTDVTVDNTAFGNIGTSEFDSKKVTVFSGQLTLRKENESQERLNGAEFTVHKVTGTNATTGEETIGDALKFEKQSDGTYKYAPESDAADATKVTTAYVESVKDDSKNESGQGVLVVTGLDVGTYRFVETKAPEGYSINENIPSVKLEKGNATAVFNKDLPVVIDTTLSSLPSTGGIGTTIFTVGGCAIMILAAGMFFVSRRKASR